MNQSTEIEIDPLATYEYFSGYGLPQINTNTHQYQNISTHQNYFDVKVEPYQPSTDCVNNYSTKSNSNNIETHAGDLLKATNCSLNEINENPSNTKENTVENIPNNAQTLIRNKKIKKEGKPGQKSYMSEKIADSNFPFYGCAVCNISFKLLTDLDSHIATHKDRITSYGLRLKNQIKRKKLRKEQKKLKKLKKSIKKEKVFEFEVEIKPEDGYIGNIKTEQFKPEHNDNIKNDQEKTDGLINGDNGVVENQLKIDIPLMEAQTDCKEKSKENDKRKNDKDQTNYNLEKMFKCFACQKQFMLSYYLKLHVRSHTDEKPYTCAECGQCFITASKLGRHTKRIHLAIRHQCRICYKYFSRFEYLTRHFDKKHQEDKLEGEPYDYNAILPYLKELEEQLQMKSEETTKEQDLKPKSDNLWDDWPSEDLQTTCKAERNEVVGEPLMPTEIHIANEKKIMDLNLPTDGVGSNKLKEEFSLEVEVKKEDEDYHEMDNDGVDKYDSAKDDSFSDEDYFPSNTWAATPKMESDPPSTATLKRQKQDGPIKCEVCEKSISSLSYLRIHMRTHTGEKPFKCYICNRGFITSSKMHRHVLTHSETWDETSNVKEEVKSELDSDTVKKKKKRSKESSTKKAKAKFLKKFKRNAAEKQMKRHQKRPHACEYCQKRFLHLETLQVHKKSHEGEELVFKCHFCLMKMDDAESLKEHEATHEEPKPYLCTLCGKTYKKRETMMYHRKHHIPEREYVCDMCPKSFTSPCKLQKHIAAHKTDKYVLRYECPVCAHMFNTRYHINMHLVTHQKEGLIVEENRSEILAMVLQNARRIPKNPDATGNMTDKVLPDEQSRMCNICGQVFQHFYYLEEHLKSHGSKIALEDEGKTEEKKHVCQVCSKSFKLHYYLKLHSFTHTKEKPYICQQCGKGFITRGKLKRHLETHTGLKKYQCHICYKFFTRPSYLRIHVRTIHGPQDFRLNKQFENDSLKESG